MVETNIGKEGEAAPRAIATMIRQSSEASQLIAESEILRRMADQHLLISQAADPAEEVGDILKKVVDGSGIYMSLPPRMVPGAITPHTL